MEFNYVAWKPKEETKKLEEKANSYGTYSDPTSVTDLLNKKNTYETTKNPGEWNGGNYGQAVRDAYEAYNSRPGFSYDINGDALYQQYKDKYINQGRLAMADTIGQASAMTGGYGNSYAATAGNQAYQSQLQNLNDIVPQLYQMAYDRYSQEGEDLKTKYSMLSNMYQTEYGEHRDKVSDYNTTLGRLIDEYNTERSYKYGQWDADRNYYQTAYQNAYNREYGAHQDTQNRLYQSVRDQVADYQWQKTYELQSAASQTERIEGISIEDSEILKSLAEEEDWDSIDKFIGSLALSASARKELQDLWLPADWGKLPEAPQKSKGNATTYQDPYNKRISYSSF